MCTENSEDGKIQYENRRRNSRGIYGIVTRYRVHAAVFLHDGNDHEGQFPDGAEYPP